jgi:hypothetical protein
MIMVRFQHLVKGSTARPRNVGEVFAKLRPKAAKPFDYEVHEMIDGRGLRCGEKERLIGMLKERSVLRRCAAAYVIGRLGIQEAMPELIKAMKRTKSPTVRCMLEFAVASIDIKVEFNCFPDRKDELLMLMGMRASDKPEEAKFADIVLKGADIKYGTVTSW